MTSGKVFIEQGGEAIVLSTQSKSFMAVNDMLYGFEHVLPLLFQASLSMLKNSRLPAKKAILTLTFFSLSFGSH